MDQVSSPASDEAAYAQRIGSTPRRRAATARRRQGASRLSGLTLPEMAHALLIAHWPILVVLLVVGAALGGLLGRASGQRYTATTRIQLTVTDPQSQAESSALADGARAIVTSPTHVTAVIIAAHVSRDVATVTREVSVEPLGMSSVVQLQVRDTDPHVAAELANGFAQDLVQTRTSAIVSPQQTQLLSDVQSQLNDVNAEINRLDTQLNDLPLQGPNGDVSPGVSVLTARRSALAQQQLALDNQRASLMASQSQQKLPVIVDRADGPVPKDASRQVPDALLGAFAGLVLALLAAGLLETFWPTVAGADAVARLLGVPFLGRVTYAHGKLASPEVGLVSRRLQSAAARASVQDVVLLPVGGWFYLGDVAHHLQPERPRRSNAAGAFRIMPSIGELAPPGNEGGSPTGAVAVVSAPSLKRHDVDEMANTLALTGWPLLGVLAHSSGSRKPLPQLEWFRQRLPWAHAV